MVHKYITGLVYLNCSNGILTSSSHSLHQTLSDLLPLPTITLPIPYEMEVKTETENNSESDDEDDKWPSAISRKETELYIWRRVDHM